SSRIWQYVIEVEFVSRTTDNAPTAIALPHRQLNLCRNHSTMICVGARWLREIFLPFDRDEFELENLPPLRYLAPRIDEMKNAFVGPNPLSDLFVHSHPFGRVGALVLKSCTIEETVLRETASLSSFGLI